jgi:hypothetical protein
MTSGGSAWSDPQRSPASTGIRTSGAAALRLRLDHARPPLPPQVLVDQPRGLSFADLASLLSGRLLDSEFPLVFHSSSTRLAMGGPVPAGSKRRDDHQLCRCLSGSASDARRPSSPFRPSGNRLRRELLPGAVTSGSDGSLADGTGGPHPRCPSRSVVGELRLDDHRPTTALDTTHVTVVEQRECPPLTTTRPPADHEGRRFEENRRAGHRVLPVGTSPPARRTYSPIVPANPVTSHLSAAGCGELMEKFAGISHATGANRRSHRSAPDCTGPHRSAPD